MGPLRLKDSVSSNQDIVAGIVCAGEVKSMKASQVKSSQVKSSQVQGQSLFFPGQRLLQVRKSALSQFAKTSTAAIEIVRAARLSPLTNLKTVSRRHAEDSQPWQPKPVIDGTHKGIRMHGHTLVFTCKC